MSPCGRNVTQEERKIFIEYNKEHKVLETMADQIRGEFSSDLTVSIGGQISFDVFPRGWDKTYCLKFIEETYDKIHFFGDKCYSGGNDYEIYIHERTEGHSIKNGPTETIQLLTDIYKQTPNQDA